MNYTIRTADWTEDRAALQAIRRRVFIEEQSVPEELEWDNRDDFARHWLALNADGEPIGTLRLLNDGHIGRMAVLRDYRGHGVGNALLQTALQQARDDKLFETYLYAQVQALDFYRKAGFTVSGGEFMDAGIPHLPMRLQLAEQRLLGVHGGNFAPPSLAAVAADIISQADQQLRILSFDLEPSVFDQPEIEASISALARKSRYSQIRLLVVDTTRIVSRGHRLLKLQRRLSSSIGIRRVRCAPHEVKDSLILADQCGIICQSIREPDKLWANFNNRPITRNYLSQFDDLWEQGIIDHDLRQLEI